MESGGADRRAYGALRVAHLNEVRAALEDHVERVDWPRERIDRYRTARLRALLAHAKQRSPFHAARMRGLDPESATVADLAQLPAMTKQEVQDEWDAIVTVPGLDRAGAERILATQGWFSYTPAGEQLFSSGGSTGVRGVYVWDWQLFVSIACLAWRMQVRDARRQPGSGPASRLAVLAAGSPPHASTPLFDVPTGAGTTTRVIAAASPFDELLGAVAEFDPSELVGYASLVGQLARAVLEGRLQIAPGRVSTNSEPLSDEDREAIAAAWGAPLHNLWGSTEIGVQAVGCGRGEGLHVCEDEVILERVDELGAPVGPGEPAARTLATGLANRSFPFIRYDLGDQVTMLEGACPCGSPLARVADIAGRRDDDFRYGERTIPAAAFRHVLGTDPAISEYQVKQTPAGADVLVVGSPDPAALTAALQQSLRRFGLRDPVIKVIGVAELERREGTGKLRRFVPS